MTGSDHDALRAAHRVGVYGLGREGRAIVAYVHRVAPDAQVEVLLDDTPDGTTRRTAEDLGVALVAGQDRVVDRLTSEAVDVVVRSPGVALRGAGLTAARRHGIRLTSGTNLWFESQAPTNVVVITGTKGKSTTSALLAHLLDRAGLDVALLGNIGAPLLDHPTPASAHDVVVVELSSYQLADLHEPVAVGVWLNLHPEHLDWHGSHEAYVRDKGRIVELSRTLVANAADPVVADAARHHTAVRWVDATGDPIRIGDLTLPRRALTEALDASALVGSHHVDNLAAALGAAAIVGVAPQEVLDHVATFTPLPHRLQLVHDDGRRWVDDSISTIPETTVAALRAFPTTPVTLLAGGFDRGQDHATLVDEIALRGDVTVVTLPDTGDRLAADLRRRGLTAEDATDLADAVVIADDCTPDGGVVLLSPAAPSYGHFTSFEQRGDRFAEFARQARPGVGADA